MIKRTDPYLAARQQRDRMFAGLAMLVALAVSLAIWTWQTLALIGLLAGAAKALGSKRRRR